MNLAIITVLAFGLFIAIRVHIAWVKPMIDIYWRRNRKGGL